MARASKRRRSEIVDTVNAALEIVDDVTQDGDGDAVRAVVAGYALGQISEGDYEDDRDDDEDDEDEEDEEDEKDEEDEDEVQALAEDDEVLDDEEDEPDEEEPADELGVSERGSEAGKPEEPEGEAVVVLVEARVVEPGEEPEAPRRSRGRNSVSAGSGRTGSRAASGSGSKSSSGSTGRNASRRGSQ